MTLTSFLSVTSVVTLKSFVFKLLYLNSNFALTLVYLNPALNNPALVCKIYQDRRFHDR